MDSTTELTQLRDSIHQLALGIEKIAAQTEHASLRHDERLVDIGSRVERIEGKLWHDNGRSYATRLVNTEELSLKIEKRLADLEKRGRNIQDGVTVGVVTKGIIAVVGMAAAGAAYSLVKMASG